MFLRPSKPFLNSPFSPPAYRFYPSGVDRVGYAVGGGFRGGFSLLDTLGITSGLKMVLRAM